MVFQTLHLLFQKGVPFKMQNTVKEHYVPQFYLKEFADESGKLHVYNFKSNKILRQSSSNICFINNLYETKWENANPALGKYVRQNYIENIFSKYEGEFSKVLTQILRVCNPSQSTDALILHGPERDLFFRFVVNMIVRNPANMEAITLNILKSNDIKNVEANQIRTILEKMGIGGADAVFLAAKKQIMLTNEPENSFPQWCFERLREMNFVFFYAQTNSFITGDIPVCMGDDPSILEEDKTSIYFALSPKVAVLFGNYVFFRNFKNHLVYIEEKLVDDFNCAFIKHQDSKQILIANSKAVIERYAKIMKSVRYGKH